MRVRGFTLVEMVTVIVITGIVAAIVAVFIRAPVQGYVDAARRARLTDAADLALRRIARDVQAALPNSLRPYGTGQSLELLPTATGGRYDQSAADAAGCFAGGCAALSTLGSVIAANGEQVGNRLVIYNLSNNDGGGCSAVNPSAWCGQNSAAIAASADGGDSDSFSFASTAFRPGGGSPARSFFIVSAPVAYVCSNVGTSGGTGTGTLDRYEGYAVAANPAFPPPGAAPQRLADRVSACSFDYRPGATERSGLLTLYLAIAEDGETAGLYHEVHVDNAP